MVWLFNKKCILLFLVITCAAVPVFAQKLPMSGNRPIKLAFYEYGFLYAHGKGIDKDIVDELSKRTGQKFELSVAPRARIWADLESGNIDMSVSGIQNETRDKFAWFAHYMSIHNYTIMHSSTAKKATSSSSFISQKPYRFGMVRAFKHGAIQDSIISILRTQNRVDESIDAETLFKKIKDGRVHAIYSQPPVFRKYLKDLQMESMVVIQDWAPKQTGVPHGLILSKKRFSESEANEWQAVIVSMKNDGTLQNIYRKYLPQEDVAKMLEQ